MYSCGGPYRDIYNHVLVCMAMYPFPISIAIFGYFKPLYDNYTKYLPKPPQRSNECACLSRARARGIGLHHFHRNKQRQNGGRFKFRGMCFISRG